MTRKYTEDLRNGFLLYKKILDRIYRIIRINIILFTFLKKAKKLNPPNGGKSNTLNLPNVI